MCVDFLRAGHLKRLTAWIRRQEAMPPLEPPKNVLRVCLLAAHGRLRRGEMPIFPAMAILTVSGWPRFRDLRGLSSSGRRRADVRHVGWAACDPFRLEAADA